ncbi:DHHC zinc finger domain-containing protein [Toxoplasma gondii ARI]|uniref:protein S-acyltransferase n=1 Tax=Toxoplasma gondii ARI TaxID=1074872 RepID=A0A139XJF4_TOXGO|nr:DHHC zinc finger domain-containing protein [Toxoplasma gondii ARI]
MAVNSGSQLASLSAQREHHVSEPHARPFSERLATWMPPEPPRTASDACSVSTPERSSSSSGDASRDASEDESEDASEDESEDASGAERGPDWRGQTPLRLHRHRTRQMSTQRRPRHSGRYCAPVAVMVVRCLVLGLLMSASPQLCIFANPSFESVFLWSLVLLTVAAYLLTALGDPGYLKYCPSVLLAPEEEELTCLGETRVCVLAAGKTHAASSAASLRVSARSSPRSALPRRDAEEDSESLLHSQAKETAHLEDSGHRDGSATALFSRSHRKTAASLPGSPGTWSGKRCGVRRDSRRVLGKRPRVSRHSPPDAERRSFERRTRAKPPFFARRRENWSRLRSSASSDSAASETAPRWQKQVKDSCSSSGESRGDSEFEDLFFGDEERGEGALGVSATRDAAAHANLPLYLRNSVDAAGPGEGRGDLWGTPGRRDAFRSSSKDNRGDLWQDEELGPGMRATFQSLPALEAPFPTSDASEGDLEKGADSWQNTETDNAFLHMQIARPDPQSPPDGGLSSSPHSRLPSFAALSSPLSFSLAATASSMQTGPCSVSSSSHGAAAGRDAWVEKSRARETDDEERRQKGEQRDEREQAVEGLYVLEDSLSRRSRPSRETAGRDRSFLTQPSFSLSSPQLLTLPSDDGSFRSMEVCRSHASPHSPRSPSPTSSRRSSSRSSSLSSRSSSSPSSPRFRYSASRRRERGDLSAWPRSAFLPAGSAAARQERGCVSLPLSEIYASCNQVFHFDSAGEPLGFAPLPLALGHRRAFEKRAAGKPGRRTERRKKERRGGRGRGESMREEHSLGGQGPDADFEFSERQTECGDREAALSESAAAVHSLGSGDSEGKDSSMRSENSLEKNIDLLTHERIPLDGEAPSRHAHIHPGAESPRAKEEQTERERQREEGMRMRERTTAGGEARDVREVTVAALQPREGSEGEGAMRFERRVERNALESESEEKAAHLRRLATPAEGGADRGMAQEVCRDSREGRQQEDLRRSEASDRAKQLHGPPSPPHNAVPAVPAEETQRQRQVAWRESGESREGSREEAWRDGSRRLASRGKRGVQLERDIFSVSKNQMYQASVKLRYCEICAMFQPLRTKHCGHCGRCTRTHDHHCPWIGTCVAEENRVYFYWFLFLQALELLAVAVLYIRALVWQSEAEIQNPFYFVALFLTLMFCLFLACMVTCLFSYHTYLMLSNLTTWESMAWHRISYLKDLPEAKGSPFNRGVLVNICIYCFPPSCCGSWRPLLRPLSRFLCSLASLLHTLSPCLRRFRRPAWSSSARATGDSLAGSAVPARGLAGFPYGPCGEIWWEPGPAPVPTALDRVCCHSL